MKKKLLIVDVDSTLNNHWIRIRKHTRPWPGGKVEPECFTEKESLKDEVLPNAFYALNLFSDTGWVIDILTARGWDRKGEATKKWLKENSLSYRNINIVTNLSEKVGWFIKNENTLRANEYNLYIDDFTSGQENLVTNFQYAIYSRIKTEMAGIVNVEIFRNNWKDIADRYLCGGRQL